MNERIQQLAEESGMTQYVAANNKYLERFAEAIVRECVSLFDGSKETKTTGLISHKRVVDEIKDHFGVEE